MKCKHYKGSELGLWEGGGDGHIRRREEKIETALIDPGKPWQNGADESFNGKFRDECLSVEWFRSRAEARVVIETWRRHFNHVHPHSSLNDLTPIEFKTRYDSTNPGAVLHV